MPVVAAKAPTRSCLRRWSAAPHAEPHSWTAIHSLRVGAALGHMVLRYICSVRLRAGIMQGIRAARGRNAGW